MANATVTAANVRQSATAAIKRLIAAVAITAGQSIYKLADGTAGLADADAADALAATPAGIAIDNAAAGQPISYVDEDPDFTPGFTIASGAIYVQSATPGAIAPATDLASTMKTSVLMIGKPSNKAVLRLFVSGQAVP